MADAERPQIYLITPPAFDLAVYPDQLARVLDTHDIACIRLSLALRDEDQIARTADALRDLAHARDVALIIENHVLMVERLGLDGVHLTGSRVSLRKLRTELGSDVIIGAYCGQTRHDGIGAAEASADYVAFGPIGQTPLGDGKSAGFELFEWWSEMIEVPVVAEGALTPDLVAQYAPVTDFFGIGSEIWDSESPGDTLKALLAPLG